jgi:formylglycine-generating enzyme required for sulfatase activity
LTPTFGPLSTVRYVVGGVDFDMVKVPPGRFVDGEDGGRRELLVSRPFEIGVTLVTQALWRAVVGSISSEFSGEDLPVEQVSWDDVQGFLVRLEALGLPGFRLPTEAEWVWAARCGAPTRWAGADRAGLVAVVGVKEIAPVAGLSSSAAGVFDLSGGLWEWQQDGWATTPSAGVDVQGPMSRNRVNRGGSWYGSAPKHARVASRYYDTSDFRDYDFGFRLLRSLS